MSSREHICPRCGKEWHCDGYNPDGTLCQTGEVERPCSECMTPNEVTEAWRAWAKGAGGDEWDKIDDIEAELGRGED
jgi:hypothetical protein